MSNRPHASTVRLHTIWSSGQLLIKCTLLTIYVYPFTATKIWLFLTMDHRRKRIFHISYIPTTVSRSHRRHYGFDQSRLLAERISKSGGNVLVRTEPTSDTRRRLKSSPKLLGSSFRHRPRLWRRVNWPLTSRIASYNKLTMGLC